MQRIKDRLRTKVRRAAGSRPGPAPIVVTDGDAVPRRSGLAGHYTNKSGDFISHPSAYSRRGWSSMVYHPCTRMITVGQGWLDDNSNGGEIYASD